MRNSFHQRRGVAIIWLALCLVVLVGLLALALDTSWVMYTNHQLKNAADASSLAGAIHVRLNQSLARTTAESYGLLNRAGAEPGTLAPSPVRLRLNETNDPNGDIVAGRYSRITRVFTPTTINIEEHPNALKVSARRNSASLGGTLPLIFGNVIPSGPAVNQANASQTSIAMIAGGLGAGLLILDPVGTQALHLQGGPDVVVLNGTIHVNSSSSTAVHMQGSYTVTGEELNIVGAMANPPTSLPVNFGMPVLPDPLAWLEAPSTVGMSVYPAIFNPGTVTLQPGHYPLGIRATDNNNNITFAPGTYVIGTPGQTGASFQIQGGTMNAVGCTFYIAGGGVDFTANAAITIKPPPLDQGHYYEHISIFQARNNNSLSTIWAGNDASIEGTLYFPGLPDASPPSGPQFDLNGGGFGEGVQVIAYRMRLGGNANLNLYFDGWWPGPLTTYSFLVQ